MAVCPSYKIDSNDTGLRVASEVCFKQLPTLAADGADPIWIALEPNSYDDFGGTYNSVARRPISQSRQRKKGTIVGLEASGGFQQDLTFFNSRELLQGFMFANLREKKTTAPANDALIDMVSVDAASKTYTTAATGGTGFVANHLVFAEGFGVTANNGVKTVASSTGTTVVVTEVIADEAAPPADAKLVVAGYMGASGTLAIAMNGNLVRLTSTAGVDFTTLGFIPGEWIYLGGDNVANTFANNTGFARIATIAAGYLEFDKVDWEAEAESGAGKTIYIYFGSVLRNEPLAADIVQRSYQLERTLGEDADGVMSEYLAGAVANELTINVPQEEKVTIDFGFVAAEHQVRSGAVGVKDGTRVGVVEGDAFNSSNDFARVKLAVVDDTNAEVLPLFAFATDLSLTINNNVSGNKAIGVLGAFGMTAGLFEPGGSLTAYFATAESIQAIRANESVTLDVAMVKDNQGIVIDLPLVTLGNGRLNIEQDQAVTVPLDMMGAESPFGHSLLFTFFPVLPDSAAA